MKRRRRRRRRRRIRFSLMYHGTRCHFGHEAFASVDPLALTVFWCRFRESGSMIFCQFSQKSSVFPLAVSQPDAIQSTEYRQESRAECFTQMILTKRYFWKDFQRRLSEVCFGWGRPGERRRFHSNVRHRLLINSWAASMRCQQMFGGSGGVVGGGTGLRQKQQINDVNNNKFVYCKIKCQQTTATLLHHYSPLYNELRCVCTML